MIAMQLYLRQALRSAMISLEEHQNVAHALENWYWEHGRQRNEPYALSLGGWLRQASSLCRMMDLGREALQYARPAMGIWGPSQTGKSTLISAYVDSGAQYTQNADEDGKGSGLHWPGGKPFFFMAPRVDDPENLPRHLTRMVLNPFNKGMDGSACLTRFTPATTANDTYAHRLTDPQYPVSLHLVEIEDIWHALARGYSTECLGAENRAPQPWDLDRLKRATNTILQANKKKPLPADQTAFKNLMRFADVLNVLASSDDPVFSNLSLDQDAWQLYLTNLFETPELLSSPTMVEKLANRILWNGSEPLSEWCAKLVKQREAWLGPKGLWTEKPLLCSLEAASLFLNMGASEIAYAPSEGSPNSARAVIKQLIATLGCRVDEDAVRIGCEPGLPQKLGGTADDFSILQGLVWELVVPINMEHLPEHPFPEDPARPNAFKTFLASADILDFPGVGNETKSIDNRIIIDRDQIESVQDKAGSSEATPADKERLQRCFSPTLFFRQILKRGKTASIVATYGKRLNIDGFSIFQGARNHACPNADQIINGVKTWLRHLAPDYAKNAYEESPFPLNLVITWWAKQLNYAKDPNDSNIYGVIDEIVGNLGIIRDPAVSTTFAINDHRSPDRDSAELKLDFSQGSQRYLGITSEQAFKQQFSRPSSRQSFDAMLNDNLTGGAEYFFLTATEQMNALAERADNRRARIMNQLTDAVSELHQLLAWPELVPQPKIRDTRRERIEAFLAHTRLVCDQANTAELRALNHYLRELINIRSSDIPSIPDRPLCTPAFIERAYDTWVSAQIRKMESDPRFSQQATDLGLADSDSLRQLLRALVDSLTPDHGTISQWLKSILSSADDPTSAQMRRLLAIRMGNALVFGHEGPATRRRELAFWEKLYQTTDQSNNPAWSHFLKPLVGKGGRLESLAEREIIPRKRPDLPGDVEIRKLFEQISRLNPDPAPEKESA